MRGRPRNWAKLKAFTTSARGVLSTGDTHQIVIRSGYMSLPDRVKYSAELTMPNGGSQTIVSVLNGLKGWSQVGGDVIDMPREIYTIMQSEAYLQWITSLVPLKDAANHADGRAGEQDRGKTALGVKVARQGKPDVQLYFDPESGLLAKAVFSRRSQARCWNATTAPTRTTTG